jgi:hypothetical protein
MSTSAIPTLIDTLFAQATAALPTVLVVDGFGVTNDANPNVLMVGVDDPDNGGTSANSTQSSQEMATAGTPRSRAQSGTITCAALSWSGGSDQKAVRDAAYATVAAVETLLRTDPRLGLSSYPLLVMQMGDDRLSQNQYAATDTTTGGVDALVIFNVDFLVRL